MRFIRTVKRIKRKDFLSYLTEVERDDFMLCEYRWKQMARDGARVSFYQDGGLVCAKINHYGSTITLFRKGQYCGQD